jgi:hypothetical protein
MNIPHFDAARDFFYLCFLFLGASLGSFLIILSEECTLRKRAMWITAIFILLSFSIGFLAGALILSGGAIQTVPSLYPFALLFFAAGAAGLRFPRAGGWSVIFASAAFFLWITFSFLVFPRLEKQEHQPSLKGEGSPLAQLSIRSEGEKQILIRRNKDFETWNIQDDGRTLTFEAVSVTAISACPLIGGEQRGVITQVTRKKERVFNLCGNLFGFSRFNKPGFSLERHTLDLPTGVVRHGITLSVLFDGKQLRFDPPVQF